MLREHGDWLGLFEEVVSGRAQNVPSLPFLGGQLVDVIVILAEVAAQFVLPEHQIGLIDHDHLWAERLLAALLLRQYLVEQLRRGDEDVGVRPLHGFGHVDIHHVQDQILVLLFLLLALRRGASTISSITGL